MSDDYLVFRLKKVIESIEIIESRFSKIKTPDDFVVSPEGLTLLDSIVIRLQVIGENVKKAYAKNKNVFDAYHEIDWEKIIRFRDLVSHHYDLVEPEIVFDICKNHIPLLKKTILKILEGKN